MIFGCGCKWKEDGDRGLWKLRTSVADLKLLGERVKEKKNKMSPIQVKN